MKQMRGRTFAGPAGRGRSDVGSPGALRSGRAVGFYAPSRIAIIRVAVIARRCRCKGNVVASALVLGLTLLLTSGLRAQSVAFEQPPIDYLNAPVHDAVAVLAKQVESGKKTLVFDDQHGYLASVLEALDVPVSSQALVFSRTSLQLNRISPRRPRAVYFSDDVYVGWCQRGDVLELAATDPQQGAIFYTLEQIAQERPRFVRDRGQCLTCHASSRTQDVPGYLVRSVVVDAIGNPLLRGGSYTTDNTSPFEQRWGGWYVTGTHGDMRHMGNVFSRERREPVELDLESGANVTDLSPLVRTDPYLTDDSDLIALLVLEHQTQMHNAIAAANYETRLALAQSYQMNELLERPKGHISDIAQRRISAAADRVVERLLMKDDVPFTSPVKGTSSFAEEFQARGPVDKRGRSLRALDLSTRLFRYPCSYLIHSPAFAGLPDEVRQPILKQLRERLQQGQLSAGFEHLTPEARSEILEILDATLPGFAEPVAS